MSDLISYVQGFTIGTLKQSAMTYLSPALKDVDPAYLVTIRAEFPNPIATSDQGKPMNVGTIVAKMQEPLQIGVKSHWHPLFDPSAEPFAQRLLDIGLQSTVGHTLKHSVTSRRVWTGTDPLSIRLSLQFFASSNAEREVIEPVKILQKCVLPGAGAISSGTVGELFLSAPGPGPVTQGGTNISIVVGAGYLKFERVIVRECLVTFANRFAQNPYGKPIAAKVDIEFETYEILTQNRLDTVYADPGSQGETKGTVATSHSAGAAITNSVVKSS